MGPIGSFMFSRAMFVYDLNPQKRRHLRRQLSSDVKAVIIYNTGLAFQLMAKEKNETSILSKATAMYRLSQTILRNANERGAKSKLCFNHFFHVALLNNLGQISYELVDYGASGHYFGQLELNLKHIVSRSKSGKGGISLFEKSDMLGMMSNTVVEIPNTAPCA